ncbi:GAF domain-containing sensor histidine kinase [Cellulophaga sp. F20128]|uniref:sensor histidine kinase n=1 Tax=Cellulophaga sp. F20128 TaxID=2926413 RepID=UPI001FF1332A|nr:GAF domain-containing sensor histidine kinase [Cellulophaga sp. F20128]MCK0156026.1 GAF domain-containing sensor histidine kinase [Cellulophaga sp. F20128]
MKEAKEHANEKERLKALESYSILDTLSESDYDDITAIAAEICGTQISLISLIDSKRQWFKSHYGVDASETPKEYAFCVHAINDQDNIFIVDDARTDERFFDNPLVTGDPKIVFYAGVPLISDNGLPLGTLCVIDRRPKLLSEGQLRSLRALGNQVMNMLNLRKTRLTLEEALLKLEEKNQDLDRFASVAAHDLKAPLANIIVLSQLVTEAYSAKIDAEGQEMLSLISKSSDNLNNMIDGLLEYTRSESVLKEKKSEINLTDLIESITGLFAYENNLKLNLKTSIKSITTNRAALEQILINLVANAIKYNDKKTIEIEVGITATASHYELYVQDNGLGIALEDQDKIFEIFEVISPQDKYGKRGNGIGLATVKKVVEKSGGLIKVESKLKKGAKFIFTIEK